jgi:hypothetical protein
MQKIKLTPGNAPKLQTFFLENVTEDEEPDFEMMLPVPGLGGLEQSWSIFGE